jgi:phosphoglucosamine mutase
LDLKGNAVAGTVMSNLALEEALKKEGRTLYRTPVGDKYIAKLMREKGLSAGGEPSGHYILDGAVLTGDAILAARRLLGFWYRGGALRPALKLKLYPQFSLARPADAGVLTHPGFIALKQRAEGRLGTNGRIIARMSGTEPVVRVMVEGRERALASDIIKEFEKFLSDLPKE